MLPKIFLTKRARAFWIIFLLLSPGAYLAGTFLVDRYDPASRAEFLHDRPALVAIGTRLAAARGVDVGGWSSFLKTGWDNSIVFYYRVRPGADVERLRAVAPPAWVRVLFRSPDAKENLEVTLTPQGRMTGFRRQLPTSSEITDPGEPSARALAEASIAGWTLPDKARLLGPEVKEDRVQNRVSRRYSWKVPIDSRPEVDLSYSVTIADNLVTAEAFETRLTESFLKEYGLIGGFSLRISGTRVSGLTLVNLILFYLAITIVFIFGLYRFVQRARQRELSYQRIAILTFVIATLFLSVILLTDVATFDNATRSGPNWPVYVVATLSYVLMGFVVAAAYGSGEGDLREAYPGKLTSLDALLTGRLFSRNVARSVVIGTAFAGWGLLLSNLVPFLWRNQLGAGTQIEMLDFIVGRAPWLSPSVIWPFDVVFTSIIGLLLPLPFLRRRLRNPKVVLVLVAVYAWTACTGAASSFTPWSGAAIIGAVRAAILLVPFFKFDLLTALVALAVPTFATASMHLVSQPSASLRQSGLVSLGIGLAFLAVELFFARRGRLLREEEVGPQYARFLAERLSMQAEVSAAREAQIRLLPQTLPQSRYFSVAAECRPAYEVGGDFYEVFQLDEDRIGIFMAEGGGRGLASALSIAFAKGFLMPKITGPARSDDSPIEIVRSLQSRLRQTLESDRNLGFVYAVIDRSDGTVRFARTGTFPRLIIGKPRRDSGDPAIVEPEEMETRFNVQSRDPDKSAETYSVSSGMSEVNSGDCVLLFTDGMARALAEGKLSAGESIWQSISAESLESRANLQKAVHGTIESTSKRALKSGVTDDLTALVVRLTPQAAP